MDEVKKLFARFDEDGDGEITVVELGKVMQSIGQNPSPEELEVELFSLVKCFHLF